MSQNLSEQEIIRRATLADIRQAGIDPYPAATYPVNTTSAEILALFDTTPERFTEVNDPQYGKGLFCSAHGQLWQDPALPQKR